MVTRDHFPLIPLTRQEFRRIWNKMKVALEQKMEKRFPNISSKKRLTKIKRKLKNRIARHLLRVIVSVSESLLVDGIDLSRTWNLTPRLLRLSKSNFRVERTDLELEKRLRIILTDLENTLVRHTRDRRELPLRAMDAYEHLVRSADIELSAISDDENDKEYIDSDEEDNGGEAEAKVSKNAEGAKGGEELKQEPHTESECEDEMTDETDSSEDIDSPEEPEDSENSDQKDILDLDIEDDYQPPTDTVTDFNQIIVNLANTRKSLPEQEKKIRAYNEVIEFLEEMHEKRQKEQI